MRTPQERLKLQAKFREGMDLYDAGRREEGLAVLRAVLKQCAEEGIALPPAMDAQLRATLAQAPAAPAPQQPTPPKPIARAAPAVAGKGSRRLRKRRRRGSAAGAGHHGSPLARADRSGHGRPVDPD